MTHSTLSEQANAANAAHLAHVAAVATGYGFTLKHGTRWDNKSSQPCHYVEIGYVEA